MFTRFVTFGIIGAMLLISATMAAVPLITVVQAARPAPGYFNSNASCDDMEQVEGPGKVTCCWDEHDFGQTVTKCQTCSCPSSGTCTQANLECGGVRTVGMVAPGGDLPQLETVPPIRGLPRGGDVPTLEQVPPPGLQPGSDIPTLEQGPGFNQGTEGEPPLPVICSEEAGLEKDPETGQCVPIESPVTEQPEEREEQSSDDGGGGEDQSNEEGQPSEESDSDDNGNN